MNIFIMDYDPFGMGSMYYEVRNRFITHEALDYNDGLRKIFLFTGGAVPDGSGLKELQAVLRYIQNSEQKNIVDDLTREIDTFVRRLKDNAEVRKHYMWVIVTEIWPFRSSPKAMRSALSGGQILQSEYIARRHAASAWLGAEL